MKVLHPEEAIKELGLTEQQIKFTSTIEIKNPSVAENKKLLEDILDSIQK